jgi:hypothetical protein
MGAQKAVKYFNKTLTKKFVLCSINVLYLHSDSFHKKGFKVWGFGCFGAAISFYNDTIFFSLFHPPEQKPDVFS